MPSPLTRAAISVLVLGAGITAPAWAQDIHLLPCAEVRFFGPACMPAGPPDPPAPPAPAPEPLFRPETMAPDTPPLMRKLLEEPTLENARAFLDWQQERQSRITEVQHLLQSLARQRRKP